MKRVGLVLLVLIIASSLAFVPAQAHSGRTDGAGGHYDSDAGEYHYHHGYPAHDHINGECPYDFKNNEDEFGETNTTEAQNGTWEPSGEAIFFTIVVGAWIVLLIASNIYDKVRKR